jgi:hypothetical protein
MLRLQVDGVPEPVCVTVYSTFCNHAAVDFMIMKGPFRYSFKPGLHRAWRCPLRPDRIRIPASFAIQGYSQHQTIFNAYLSIIRNQLRYQTPSQPIRSDSEPTYSGSRVFDPPLNAFSASIHDWQTHHAPETNMYLQWRKQIHLNSLLGLLDGMKRYSGDQLCPSVLNGAYPQGPWSGRLTQVQWTKVHGPSHLCFPRNGASIRRG